MKTNRRTTENHECAWDTILWDEGVVGPFVQDDEWIVEQYGTCTCGKRVTEVFKSDDKLRVEV